MSVVEAPAIQESLRGKLRDRVSDEIADEAIALLMEAMRSQKTAVGVCKTCRTNVTVTVTDAKAASTAFDSLMNQTEGRPGVAGDDAGQGVTISRVVVAGADAAIRDVIELAKAGDIAGVLARAEAAVLEQPLDSRK